MNALTPHQAWLLVKAMEEAAELQHACARLLQFGRRGEQDGVRYDNVLDLSGEAGDLRAALDALDDEGLLRHEAAEKRQVSKRGIYARRRKLEVSP